MQKIKIKKIQQKGLTFSILILMILSLIAVVVFLLITNKSLSAHTKSTGCENIGGKCLKAEECSGEKSFLQGCKKNEICCIREENN